MASKEIVLEVDADKTKYVVMSRDQNAGRSHSINIHKSSCQRVERVQSFGNNINKSKFHSGRKSQHTAIRECFLSFGEESIIFHFVIQNYRLRYKEL